ncbi:hypothetical protein GALMADRAFT_233294 [Galerina marginata CBS 339.88]|uniref:Spc7 kinetochore protein domain-containing protein n=1 Tax=Galerina marginata (strain CBS 339.88) TaxID=685588 RepID=A0A067TNQ6_GALM3|nr:hypothetical protein GALMADRAFT_233294 [Galerina marginata CBS 339.88]
MATKKPSPNRRRSIAVPNQKRHSLVPEGRRRAHSIVPGASLSPLAKARRSLAPRKSILKASINALNVDSSSQPTTQSQSSTADDTTRSMDITQDYTALVHDNTSRKSFGRRVSFASHSHVRMFDTTHTNSTGSPQSSPAPVSDSPRAPPPQLSNENDYPGQTSRRRRSSARYSLAQSEDMDLTTIAPLPNASAARGSAILEEEFDYEDDEYDADNMDVTQAINGDFARKRSLSMGVRQASSDQQLPEADESRSDIGNESTESAISEQSGEYEPMEFTVPLGQSLRPADQDQVWLALKQMTHSGENPSEPESESSFDDRRPQEEEEEDMNLDDAMARLRRARDSLPSAQQAAITTEPQEDSFTSTEDSFDDEDINNGNKTMNLSQVLGRVSLGPNSRISIGYQDSNMDESEVYGNIVASTPRQSLAPQARYSEAQSAPASQQPRKSSVFQPPPSGAAPSKTPAPISQTAKPTNSVAFSFAPRAPSPSKSNPPSSGTPLKAKAKPTFSAAFAPPTARPSPKKPDSDFHPMPAKRSRPSQHDENVDIDTDKPSPAKRQALAGKWLGAADQTSDEPPAPAAAIPAVPKSRPLSPSKKAPFQAFNPTAPEPTSRPSSALRRPSGYFAKRKSLAVGFSVPSSSSTETASQVEITSTKKKPGIGVGRASLGSCPTDAWTRFDKDADSGLPVKSRPTRVDTKEKEKDADHCVREVVRQASASPSPTRGSPAPKVVQKMQPRELSSEPEEGVTPPDTNPVEEETQTQEVVDVSAHMDLDINATEQWREGVQQAEYEEEEEVPSISVAQFFSMTGIRFMDELTAPRRSMHPSQQPVHQPRNSADIPLAEYVTAMAIDIPQLDLYSRVSKDLEGWMAKSKVVFAQAEEEAAKVTPELFVEYARADEEGQAELMHQLNLIRTHTRFLARSDWYDWKLQWVEGLRVTADEAFASLEKDARALEEPKKAALEIIPALEKEYEELMRELEQEQAEVAEIEESDQDYLNELKATIAEQNIEIEALKAELAEGNDQLRWLQERSSEIETQKREARNTIATAQRILHMKQTSTRSEVFRLKSELEALEDLHMSRITKVHADLFEYIYASLFRVSIPCKNFLPVVTKVSITRFGKASTRYKDDFPRLSSFLLSTGQQLITEGDDLTVREIVHRLSDYWSACAQLRSQLTLLNIKYPVEISVCLPSRESPLPSFKAKTMVMFPSVKGKAFISFVFGFETLSQWPMSIKSLDCEVEVAYGPMDPSAILEAVSSRISQATPSDNYACLLDACIEAQDVHH